MKTIDEVINFYENEKQQYEILQKIHDGGWIKAYLTGIMLELDMFIKTLKELKDNGNNEA